MNPRTLCACQSVAFIISASVAPFLRRSKPRTAAFLLPSRAAAGLPAALARFPFAALVGSAFGFAADFAFLGLGAVLAASAGLSPFRLWIAFQIRASADFRSVNFLTGVR